MRLYRPILTFLFACLISTVALAQSGKLSGSLKDEAGQPVPFANVAVLSLPDSAVVTGSVADFDGKFAIASPEKGNYLLRLSAVGYSSTFSAAFAVSGPEFSKTFTAFTLAEEAQMLQEVAVEAMRPRVVMEADKMVVSVEGTALASGSSAFDVLAKSPGVWVDEDGELHLNGQSGVRVMIDGRVTYLSGKELQGLLESMSAENIQDIEIIANPSAKYDAEGTAGILNINLKQNTLSGMNGSVYTNYNFNSRHTYGLGTNLNYKKGDWNSFVNLDYTRRERRREMYIERTFDNASFVQDGQDERLYLLPSARLGADYKINDNHSLGVMANVSHKDLRVDWLTNTDIYEAAGKEQIEALNLRDQQVTNATFNLHYTGQLDTSGTALTVDLNYVKIDRYTDGGFINDYRFTDGNQAKEAFDTDNIAAFDIYSAQLDLTKPMPALNGKLEAGAKASHVISDSDLQFYEVNAEGTELMPERSNHFIYDETIFAGYANLHSKLGEKWMLQAGLRAEKTIGEGYSVTLDETTPRSYLNFFPSVFLKQNVSENYQLSYNYSRRIQRPKYDRLNPFFFYLDPYSSVMGNPYLKPRYTHSFGVTQTIKQTYNLSLNYDYTTNFVAEIAAQDNETKQTFITYENLENYHNLSMMFNAPVQILPKWSTMNTVLLAHEQYRVKLAGEVEDKAQFNYRIQSTHNIKLPKDFGLEVNASYSGPAIYGTFRLEPRGFVDVGMKKSFMNDQLTASMTVTDIFRTNRIKGDIDVGKYNSHLDQYLYNRGLRLSLRYNFSKGEKFESKSRRVRLEELNRAGG